MDSLTLSCKSFERFRVVGCGLSFVVCHWLFVVCCLLFVACYLLVCLLVGLFVGLLVCGLIAWLVCWFAVACYCLLIILFACFILFWLGCLFACLFAAVVVFWWLLAAGCPILFFFHLEGEASGVTAFQGISPFSKLFRSIASFTCRQFNWLVPNKSFSTFLNPKPGKDHLVDGTS